MIKYSTTHEQRHHSDDVKPGSERMFGFVFAVVFGLIAAYPLINGKTYNLWAGLFSVVLLATALLMPQTLRPLNRLWFRIGLLLHKIVSPLIMGVVFFGTVLPTGLLMRMLGKQPLTLKFDPTAKSYWIERGQAEPAPESMKNQF